MHSCSELYVNNWGFLLLSSACMPLCYLNSVTTIFLLFSEQVLFMNVARHCAPDWCAKLADFYVLWKSTHFHFGFLLQEKFCYYEKQNTKITLCSNPLIQKADLTYAVRQPFVKGRKGVSDAFLIKGTLFRTSEPPAKKAGTPQVNWHTQHGQGLTFEPIGNDVPMVAVSKRSDQPGTTVAGSRI